MGIAVGELHVEEGFGAVAATLVQHHGIDVEQLVLADGRLDQPRELVGAATGSAGDDDLHVPLGFPGVRQGGQGTGAEEGAAGQETDGVTGVGNSHGWTSVVFVMGVRSVGSVPISVHSKEPIHG
ncbi:hypothetical protein D9M69_537860 [compost metagenome]